MIRLWRVDNRSAVVGVLEYRRLTKVRPKTRVFAGGGTLGLSVFSMMSFAGCKEQNEQARVR